jgi:hypothetical protein
MALARCTSYQAAPLRAVRPVRRRILDLAGHGIGQ